MAQEHIIEMGIPQPIHLQSSGLNINWNEQLKDLLLNTGWQGHEG